MKKGIFYTETVIKLLEDIKPEIYGLSDDLKKIKIKFLNEKGKSASKEEIEKYLELKSIANISENSVQKEIKKIKSNKSKMKKITEELASKIDDPLELVTKLEEFIVEEVKKILQERAYFKKNKIIRIAGITKEENNEIVLYSKAILWKEKMKKVSQQGIKVFSNSKYQIPVVLKKVFEKQHEKFVPTKNSFKVILSPLSNIDHLKLLMEHLYRTLQARKDNKINAIPTIFITVNKNDNIDDSTKKIIDNINNLQKNFIENKNFDNIDKLYESFNQLLDEIIKNPTLMEKLQIKLPLPLQILNLEQLKMKLKDNLLDIGVKIKEKEVGKEKLNEIVNEIIEETFDNYIEINTTYRIDDLGYGFFENNLDIYNETPKAILASKNYDEIVEKIFKKVDDVKNKK